MRKIVIVDLWTNSNNGDEVLQSGLITMLRRKFPLSQISGVFRFGFNEFRDASEEINRTVSKLDFSFSGPRRTLYAGKNALRLSPLLHALFSILSFTELFFNLFFFKCGLKFLCKKSVLDTLCEIEEADIVIWKGKNYRDYKGMRGTFRIATLVILGYVSVVLNKNVYCINASIWRMKNRLQKRLLNLVLKKCRHVTVRDEDSLLHFNDFVRNNYSYCADLSFYDLKENYSKYFCAGFSSGKQYDVALTLTQWGDERLQNAYINYLVEFLFDLNKNQKCDSIVIIPQVNRTSESNDKVKSLFIRKLNEKTNIVISDISVVSCVDELLKLYKVSKVLIGTRMHSCVFSFFVGTPFIGIAYDNGPKWSILRKIWPQELILDYELLQPPKTVNFDFFDLEYCQNQFELMYNSSFLNVSEIN